MRLLILFFLISFWIPAFSQDLIKQDTLSKGERKIIGIWKYDLADQRSEESVLQKFQSESTDEAEQKKFWKKTESWICHLMEDKKYLKAWVENGVLIEQTGTWLFDDISMVLSLVSEESGEEYRVNFTDKGQVWIPVKKEEGEFSVLYLKGLGL